LALRSPVWYSVALFFCMSGRALHSDLRERMSVDERASGREEEAQEEEGGGGGRMEKGDGGGRREDY
jgi:hypothetical protein